MRFQKSPVSSLSKFPKICSELQRLGSVLFSWDSYLVFYYYCCRVLYIMAFEFCYGILLILDFEQLFCCEILRILDHQSLFCGLRDLESFPTILSWDPRDPGTQTEIEVAGSCGSWIVLRYVAVRSCRSRIFHNNNLLHLEIFYIQWNLVSGSPILGFA